MYDLDHGESPWCTNLTQTWQFLTKWPFGVFGTMFSLSVGARFAAFVCQHTITVINNHYSRYSRVVMQIVSISKGIVCEL